MLWKAWSASGWSKLQPPPPRIFLGILFPEVKNCLFLQLARQTGQLERECGISRLPEGSLWGPGKVFSHGNFPCVSQPGESNYPLELTSVASWTVLTCWAVLVPDQPGCRRLSPTEAAHSCVSRSSPCHRLRGLPKSQVLLAVVSGVLTIEAPVIRGAATVGRGYSPKFGFIFRITWSTVRTYLCHKDLIFMVGRIKIYMVTTLPAVTMPK